MPSEYVTGAEAAHVWAGRMRCPIALVLRSTAAELNRGLPCPAHSAVCSFARRALLLGSAFAFPAAPGTSEPYLRGRGSREGSEDRAFEQCIVFVDRSKKP